jgi:hypothetical protein
MFKAVQLTIELEITCLRITTGQPRYPQPQLYYETVPSLNSEQLTDVDLVPHQRAKFCETHQRVNFTIASVTSRDCLLVSIQVKTQTTSNTQGRAVIKTR